MRNGGRTSVVVAALALLGACSGGGGDQAGPAGEPASTTSTTAPAQVPQIEDWLDRDQAVDLGEGFTLTHCEGDAPVLCFSGREGAEGIIELSSFPITTLDAVQAARSKGERAALEAHVAEYTASLREDRVAGCGAGYTVTSLPTTFVDGEEGPVVSYGFTGARRGEEVSERTVQWAAIRDENLVLLNLSGYDEGACVPAEGEGSVPDVVVVERLLRPLVEANPLPTEVAAGGA